MPFVVNIIGAGHLGKTLGFLFNKSGIQIGGVCNRSVQSAQDAIDFIGSGQLACVLDELPPADLVLITTPDAMIESVCNELSQTDNLKNGSMIIHCSGSLTSDILSSVRRRHCWVASVHPMRSFADPMLSVKQYKGTYCAIEGDAYAIACVTYLFNLIGSIPYQISKENKSSYHAACVFASNYLVTLAHQSLSCLEQACVDKELGAQMIINLMRGTLANLERTLSPVDSLTGPIKRGDTSTIKHHLDNFQCVEQKRLYAELGLATLPLACLDRNTELKLIDLFGTL